MTRFRQAAPPRRQSGIASVEFAIVGVSAMMVLIGCIEIGRMLFVWNTIAEATRRGARVATVVSSATTAKNAVLAYGSHLHGLTTGNIAVNYYTETGAAATGPSDTALAFVSVSITGYTHTLLIPGYGPAVTVPAFTTTIPAESVGVDPD